MALEHIESSYQVMASDQVREQDAKEWCNALYVINGESESP